MKQDVIIVGAGIAGLRSAYELSRLGLSSVIVEREAFPGGHAARLSCKATDQCQRCGACQLEDVLEQVRSSSRASLLLRSTIESCDRTDRGFLVRISRRPIRIVPELCIDCGACASLCPSPGAIARSPLDYGLYVDEGRCGLFTGASCRACAEVCPEHAINLTEPAKEIEVEAAAFILASGFKAFDPSDKPRFGYGLVPGVVSALELDEMLRQDAFSVVADSGPIRSVAFIQCVGSRDPRIGRNYCSRVCCGYAMRMARLLKSRFPGVEPWMFYMDIQTYDRDFDRRLKEAEQEVRLVRTIPAEIRSGPDNRPELVYHGPADERVVQAFDLVVLSVGISSAGLIPEAQMLGIGTNRDGFLGGNAEETATIAPGVFLAGTVQGPRSIPDSISHAIRAASEAASHLARSEGGR